MNEIDELRSLFSDIINDAEIKEMLESTETPVIENTIEDTEYEEEVEDLGHPLEYFTEATIADEPKLKDLLYPRISTVLKDPKGTKAYKALISDFIDRNIDKLSTPGPQFLIVFGDSEKEKFYSLFKIEEKEIVNTLKEVVKAAGGSSSSFKFVMGHPILPLLYYCIRFYTINSDKKGLNGSISLFAIDVYWSIFTKYFPNGVIAPVMNYTIDNLTDKFIIKKTNHIFGAITESASRSYSFHKTRVRTGNDNDCIAFMQRIHNDQNSMIKKIANAYNENHKAGNAISTRNDDYDPENPILDAVENLSTSVQMEVDTVIQPLIANGIDLSLAEAAARMTNISFSNLHRFLSEIMVTSRLDEITKMVECIIYLYLYTEKKRVRDIKSQYFIVWILALFKKTNSKDPNITMINQLLDKWGTETGIYELFRNEGSRINYKKGIFLYIGFSIQKYTS
jgi:hypothetical protein